MSTTTTQLGQTPVSNAMAPFLRNLESKLGKSLEPLKQTTKEISSSKFGKNAKEFGKALKGMGAASIQSWKLEQLMKLIEPFLQLLKLLEIPINVISALLTVMVNEIFKDLIPYVIDFSKWLMQMIPLFRKAGDIIGDKIVKAIKWFVEQLTDLWDIIKPYVQLLKEELKPTWEKIVSIVKEVVRITEPFWSAIRDGFLAIKQAWIESGGKLFGRDGFIARSFRAIGDILKNIVNGIIGTINNVITKINSTFGIDIGTIPRLAEGGILTAPALVVAGDNKGAGTGDPEVISPLSKLKEMGFGNDERIIDLLEDNLTAQRTNTQLLRQIIEIKGFSRGGQL